MPDTRSGSASSGGIAGWLVAGLLALFMLARCGSNDTTAAAATETRYVNASVLNCRSDPVPYGNVVRQISRGEAVTIDQTREGWSRSAGDRPCWVSADYLVATTEAAVSGSGWGSTTGSGQGISSGTAFAAGATAAAVSKASYSKSRKASKYKARKRAARYRKARSTPISYGSDYCPCRGGNVCIGPRGGRYCITSGGNKRYGV